MRIRQDCRTGFLYVLSSRCVFYNNLISRLPILLGSAKWETTGVLVRRLEVFPEKPEKPCRAAGPITVCDAQAVRVLPGIRVRRSRIEVPADRSMGPHRVHGRLGEPRDLLV